MNHKLYIFLLLSLFSNAIYAQKTNPANNFILKGTTTDKKTHVIWLTYSLGKQPRIKRKAYVKKGAFSFSCFIPGPVYAELYFNSKPLSNHDWGINEVFLSPGKMTIALTGDSTTNALITGSAMQDDWTKIKKQEQPIERLKYIIDRKSNEISAGGNTPKNHAAVLKLGSERDNYNEREKQIEYEFIASNPGSYLSPYLTAYHFDMYELPLDSTTLFYNTFTAPVKNTIAGKALYETILKHSISARGGIAPLFVKKDIDGKTIDLKSFRDKNYVLVYFWASWCLYKSDEPAHLVSLYKKYRTKGLEIVGISQDIICKDWKNAINQNGLGKWHNILTKYDDSLQDKYNINGMPPSILILIDKQGKIIGRYLGDHAVWVTRGDNDGGMNLLDKKLSETFGK
ncbi:TlpA disulfide reductase family protein [Mucilaginibacter dorajii]|uniref:TlpA disulfide reductase family protein n=1 Tax=Mucilaginibacter dorajii TaxID=692994 RepID=A0ABP7Q235_9SPHI|nr:TlpA disulfide reductase family protein [Mucilaginibacter dorajii]MCS3732789.1 peroxiredoxin [Mucilaginibacter dorajii]